MLFNLSCENHYFNGGVLWNVMVLLEDNFMSRVRNRVLGILISLTVFMVITVPVLADGVIAGQ